MTDLEKGLNNALDDFVDNIEFLYNTFEGKYCTKDDMKELAKQVFYTLNEMKNVIVKALK